MFLVFFSSSSPGFLKICQFYVFDIDCFFTYFQSNLFKGIFKNCFIIIITFIIIIYDAYYQTFN